MGIVTFFIAAFVALPKQLAAVYLGVSENSGAPVDENGGASSHVPREQGYILRSFARAL